MDAPTPPKLPAANPSVARTGCGPAALVAVALFVLPLLYVLSIGPVVALVEKTDMAREPVEAFYAPVIWLHNHTFLKGPLEWYADLWGWQ